MKKISLGADLTTCVIICKVVLLIVGVATLGLGLYSHYQTAWNKTVFINLDPDSSWGELNIKLYKICDFKDIEPEWRNKSCPSINMEHFFIAMIIICFLMSLITFTVEIFVHVQDYPFRFLDMGYHAASAILLAISGSMYILSAIQISNFFDMSDAETDLWREYGLVFKKHEKIATGVLALIQSILFGVNAVLIVLQ